MSDIRDKFERGAVSLGFHCDREDGKYVDQWLQSGWELFVAGNDKSEIDALKAEVVNIRASHKKIDEGKQQLIDSLYERCNLHANQLEAARAENERLKAMIENVRGK